MAGLEKVGLELGLSAMEHVYEVLEDWIAILLPFGGG